MGIESISLPRETDFVVEEGSSLTETAFSQVELDTVSGASDNEVRYLVSLVDYLRSVFEGKEPAWTPMVSLGNIDGFALDVLKVTLSIPRGATRSYAWVAEQAGNKGAARAAGSALGRNPLPIIIPCHRVIHSNGTLGGFSSGAFWKKKLLSLESGCPVTDRGPRPELIEDPAGRAILNKEKKATVKNYIREQSAWVE
ncbi:MAG: MGMT family protein [Actinobacteria bacterium]|nr:MGMT family protein [Actinomycetota bacterium]